MFWHQYPKIKIPSHKWSEQVYKNRSKSSWRYTDLRVVNGDQHFTTATENIKPLCSTMDDNNVPSTCVCLQHWAWMFNHVCECVSATNLDWSNLIDALPQNMSWEEIKKNIYLMCTQQCDATPSLASSCRSTSSMNICLYIRRHIIINDISHSFNIHSTSHRIGGNKYLYLPFSEGLQGLAATFNLILLHSFFIK
jgi:hypothetical protein